MSVLHRMPVSIFGVPTDVGASQRGASMGPEALRVAELLEVLVERGIDVVDTGDLNGPRNPRLGVVGGYRHLDEVVAWNRAVFDRSTRELQAGRMPVMLGGDHCLGVGSIAAVARHCAQMKRPLRVLWLDAHADFNTSEITPSGNLHGMPVACLCGMGPEALTRIGGDGPAIRPQQLRLIGIRSVDPGEQVLVRNHALEVYDMSCIGDIGIEEVAVRALAGMTPDTHLHVSFDVDMLDPGVAPGTGTTVSGGIEVDEARLLMDAIARSRCLASLDIVEVNPALDHHNVTAEIAVSLVGTLFD